MKNISKKFKTIVLAVMMPFLANAGGEYHTWCLPWDDGSCINLDEDVTLLDSNAYYDANEDNWKLNIKGWIYEKDLLTREAKYLAFVALLAATTGPIEQEPPFLRERAYPFLVDNKGYERIVVLINGKKYKMHASTGNGIFTGVITLSNKDVAALKNANNYINYKLATSYWDRRLFSGKVKVVEPSGMMIISDIDDTIKVSEVYLGTTELIRNTFLKEVEIANGMQTLYTKLYDENINTTFHYVSGSPLQLYDFLHNLVVDNGFKEGSLHLKNLRLNPLSAELYDFIDPDSTYVHKLATISNMMEKNPNKIFILIGDTGEKDPDVYGKLLELYPTQIKAIYLRNVTGETVDNGRMLDIFGDYASEVTLIEM